MRNNRSQAGFSRLGILLSVIATVALLSVGWYVYHRNHRSTPITSSGPSPSGLKTPIMGLIDKSGLPPASYRGSVDAAVLQVDWSALQPVHNGPITPDNAIDKAIAQVEQLDQSNPDLHVELKLRVLGGIYAPEWAKNLGGPPVTITNPKGGATGTIGRFWTAAYGEAYQTLQDELAAKYDNVSVLHETTVDRCTTFFDEPFIRDVGSQQSVKALLAAGFTTNQDQQCEEQQLMETEVWKHTLIDISFNPYQQINSNGSTTANEAFTEQMMMYCRHLLGKQCVLENNSIDNTRDSEPGYTQMYAQMKELGAPIAFQTATLKKISNYTQVLQFAREEGATSVELNYGYERIVSPPQLAPFSANP